MIDPNNHIISRSLLAGVIVGIGGYLFLSCINTLFGAILMALCFLSCSILNLNLFTDRAGFLSGSIDFRRLTLVLICNLFTAFIFGLISRFLNVTISNLADNMLLSVISSSYLLCIIKAIIAGFLFTLAIESGTKSKSCIIPIICITGFIYTSCFNCVLNSFYYGASSVIYENPSLMLHLLLVIVFNFIGCNLYNLFVNKSFIHKVE